MAEIFNNLTAGLEALDDYIRGYPNSLQFIRIQSTHLERKNFEEVLTNLDNNFLMKLAIGKECIVLDYTSRKKKNNTSRACWQGLEWIRYCINRIWFKRKIKCDHGMDIHFNKQFEKLKHPTRKRIKYFRKFVSVDDIKLSYKCWPTDNDNNNEYYIGIVERFLK